MVDPRVSGTLEGLTDAFFLDLHCAEAFHARSRRSPMNFVMSFFAPLFGQARVGWKEGRLPAKTAIRFSERCFSIFRRKPKSATEPITASDGPLRLKWTERDSFFDPAVQGVLKERHPSLRGFGKASFKGYAIDAWQVVDRFGRTEGRSEHALAQFGVFMRLDPVWISKLLSAVVQAQHRSTSCAPDVMTAENARREQIMREWAECWIAHYRLHSEESRSSEPLPARQSQGEHVR